MSAKKEPKKPLRDEPETFGFTRIHHVNNENKWSNLREVTSAKNKKGE